MKTLKKRPHKTAKRRQYSNVKEYSHIEALKEKRKELNNTQEQIAEMLGVKYNTFVYWENGYNLPRYDKFLRWCELFNYNPFKNEFAHTS